MLKENNAIQDLAIPCVRDLMLTVDSITLDANPLEVLALLQTTPELPALPIVDDANNCIGIVVRHNYLSLMTDNRAHELFAHDAIRAVPTNLANLFNSYPDVFTAPLIAHVEDSIDRVARAFLAHDTELSFAVLPVINNRGIQGIVKVSDIFSRLMALMTELPVIQNLSHASQTTTTVDLHSEKIDLPSVRGLVTRLAYHEMSSDFYDYYLIDEQWVVMLVGDVSGQGDIPLMMSSVKAAVNQLEIQKEIQPASMLTQLNTLFVDKTQQSLSMTLVAVCLNTKTGELLYANAGHESPYIYCAFTGYLDTLELNGWALGQSKDAVYEQQSTQLKIADRLFLFTDGIIKEKNAQGDSFGHERLGEILLRYAENDLTIVHDKLLESLSTHAQCHSFSDDVTVFCVEYYEPQRQQDFVNHHDSLTVSAYLQDFELVRIIDSFYRTSPSTAISPHIARQNIAFLAEANFVDLIPSLAAQGVRRILVRHHTINRRLGWNKMLKQHQYRNFNDLATYLPQPRQHWQFQITHSNDKAFIIEEVDAWLEGMNLPYPDRVDAVVLLLDELIENGLYAAPRDGKNRPLYAKGTRRKLMPHESLQLTLAIQNDILGISVSDNWGTLTPSIFLNRLSRDIQGSILDSGVGGGGLYFIWRMSDYVQLRVFPHQQTQVCAFLDLNDPFQPEIDKSFQFFYHTEINEESRSEIVNTPLVDTAS